MRKIIPSKIVKEERMVKVWFERTIHIFIFTSLLALIFFTLVPSLVFLSLLSLEIFVAVALYLFEKPRLKKKFSSLGNEPFVRLQSSGNDSI